jgi:hypothetical protein
MTCDGRALLAPERTKLRSMARHTSPRPVARGFFYSGLRDAWLFDAVHL